MIRIKRLLVTRVFVLRSKAETQTRDRLFRLESRQQACVLATGLREREPDLRLAPENPTLSFPFCLTSPWLIERHASRWI